MDPHADPWGSPLHPPPGEGNQFTPPPFKPDYAFPDPDAAASAAVSDASLSPLRVTGVDVVGLRRTALATVIGQLTPLTSARTLGAVATAAHECVGALLALGPFAGVDVELDDGGEPGTARARVTVDERPPLSGRSGTYVSGTEGSVEMELVLTGALGRAERLAISVERGASGVADVALHAGRRAPRGLPIALDASAHVRSRSWASTASFTETAHGLVAGVASLDGAHALALDAVWRTLADATGHASATVKRGAGHTLKTALRYTRRLGGTWGDGPGEAGAAARCITELAAGAPGGDAAVRHVRQSLDAVWHVPLAPGVSIALAASAGVLAPLTGGARPCIPERFFLGGFGGAPCAPLRGFTPRAVGPVDARHVRRTVDGGGSDSSSPSGGLWDFVGGDVGASVAAFLRFALPHAGLTAAGLYGHAFAGVGGLAALPGGARAGASAPSRSLPPLAAAAADVASNWRASAGVGIVWPTAVGNLEVDWVAVLRRAPHDRARTGFHVGFAPRL